MLEFRTSDQFNIRFLGKTQTFWDKTIASLEAEHPKWIGQRRPSELSVEG